MAGRKPGFIHYEFLIRCGRCRHEEYSTGRTHAQVREFERDRGRVETKDVGWVCPDCAGQRRVERKAEYAPLVDGEKP